MHTSWGSLLANIVYAAGKLMGKEGSHITSQIGTMILPNTPRNPVTGGKIGNRYKGEDSRQALIFNCLNFYQNLEDACSFLLDEKFFLSRWFNGYFIMNLRQLHFKVLSQVMICDP